LKLILLHEYPGGAPVLINPESVVKVVYGARATSLLLSDARETQVQVSERLDSVVVALTGDLDLSERALDEAMAHESNAGRSKTERLKRSEI